MKIAKFLTDTEFEFLKLYLPTLEFNRDYTDDELIEIEEKVSDLYVERGFDSSSNLTEFGKMIEPIVDEFSEA